MEDHGIVTGMTTPAGLPGGGHVFGGDRRMASQGIYCRLLECL